MGHDLLEPTAPRLRARQRVRRERARRRRRRLLLGVAVGALAALAVAGGTMLLASSRDAQPEPNVAATDAAQPAPEQSTLLLVRHPSEPGPASGVTLLAGGAASVNADDAQVDVPAAVVFLPVGTLVDLPGFGTDRLGLAYQYGGPALVEAAVENLLGIDVDHVAAVSESGLAALLERTGGLTLDVPQRLVVRAEDGSAQVRFEPGAQVLDGPRLAEYWGFEERDELDALPRQQQVLAQLFVHAANDPTLLARLVGDGAPQLETSAPQDWLAALLTQLSQAAADDLLTFTLLPVEPFGVPGPDGRGTFRADEPAVQEMVRGLLADSVPPGGGAQALRVQVLNGVGVPGVGQEVDRRLQGAGVRIVLTDNARSFDFAETRILVYDESPELLEAAERVREHLGVGTIQVSRQAQNVVDITIVVGADFLAATGHGESVPGAEQAPPEPGAEQAPPEPAAEPE